MRTEVTAKHFDLTPAIEDYARQKAEKLTKFYDGVQEIEIVLTKPQHDQAWEVELIADVAKHEDFVAKAKGQSVYEGIDLAVEKLSRQLSDFKERLKNSKR
jgi:putative sigma-54 modulation protein